MSGSTGKEVTVGATVTLRIAITNLPIIDLDKSTVQFLINEKEYGKPVKLQYTGFIDHTRRTLAGALIEERHNYQYKAFLTITDKTPKGLIGFKFTLFDLRGNKVINDFPSNIIGDFFLVQVH